MISICTYNLPGHFSELWRTHCSVSHKGNCWCHRSGKETEDHWPGGHRGGQHWLQWGHQKGNHSHEVREHNNHEYLGLFSRVVSCVLLKITYCFPKTIILATAYKCTFSAGNKGLLTWLLKTGQNLTSGQLSYVYRMFTLTIDHLSKPVQVAVLRWGVLILNFCLISFLVPFYISHQKQEKTLN